MALTKLILASALLVLSSCHYHAEGADVVRDRSGNPIQVNNAYYLIPLVPGGGGVTLASTQDPSQSQGACPDKLAITGNPSDTGIPVRLNPQTRSMNVPVGGLVRLQFGILFRCIPTTWWAVQMPGSSTRGGGLTHLVPGRKDGNFDWFRVDFDRSANGYFLQYCKGGAGACQEVGVQAMGSDQFLVVGGNRFRFVFQPSVLGAGIDEQSQRMVD